MTYCGNCSKEVKNDEWREHTLSEEHLEHTGKNCCSYCKMTFYSYINSKDSQVLYEKIKDHKKSNVHKQNMQRLGYSC